MSHTRDIDNDDSLFLFDTYEPLTICSSLEEVVPEPSPCHSSPLHTSLSTPSFAPALTPYWYSDHPSSSPQMLETASSPPKGKSVSQPLYIQGREPHRPQIDTQLAEGSSSSPGACGAPLERGKPSASSLENDLVDFMCSQDPAADALSENVGPSSGKGKAREQPPTLPPLVFLPTTFDYSRMEWSEYDMSPQTAGPSSYGSGFSTIGESEPSSTPSSSAVASPASAAPVEEVAVRRRTLSNVSVRSTRSLSALSLSKVKVKFAGSKSPGHIARKLRFKKGDATSDAHAASPVVDTDLFEAAELGRGSCFLPWARDLKGRTIPPQGTLVDIDVGPLAAPILRVGPPSELAILRAKGRSYSSPFPLGSASPLDIIPLTHTDLSEPVRVEVPDYFDECLPRELRLKVLATLVELHEAEHIRLIASDRWTARKAGRTRWVGAEKGVMELLRLSRVSKAWQSLVYDGQLWARLPKLPPAVLARLCKDAGGFVKRLELAGTPLLSPDLLTEMTEGLCIEAALPNELPHTRVTTINLQGCSALSTRSLHHLLIRSPALETLCVKGLPAVTNTTCTILATYCPRLVSLDMGRCNNLDGEGIRSLASCTLLQGETLRLKVLRLSGLKRVTDEMMQRLGKAAPDLEVLDLSYARHLHNSAIDAFLSLTEEEAQTVASVELTAREAGRDPTDASKYWRRVTRLRHLALSACIMLTDHALTHLAHAVPQLEFLELAGIGADLRDTGLVRLLETTPYIRRLDLEDASELSDAVLAALTPSSPDPNPPPPRPGQPAPLPEPGHALEQLVVSHAGNLTPDALLALLRACPRLRALEADNTRMNSAVVRAFVSHAREHTLSDPYLGAVDCRAVGEHVVREVAPHARPRRGWRAYEARKLAFVDGRDEDSGVGPGAGAAQDECDARRVVLKTFYSWQAVDRVRAERERRRKAAGRRVANGSASSAGTGEMDGGGGARTRWWTPSGRRSVPGSPGLLDGEGRDGCTIM